MHTITYVSNLNLSSQPKTYLCLNRNIHNILLEGIVMLEKKAKITEGIEDEKIDCKKNNSQKAI